MLQRVDYHIHSSFSDGEADYRQILDRAKDMKLDAVAITDHFDRFDRNPRTSSITDDELLQHFAGIREYGESIGQKVLCGIETCTDFYGNLRITRKVMQSCDIIITSPHYVEYDGNVVPGNYFDECYWDAYKRKVLNMAAGEGDILGHCEAYLPYGRLMPPGTTTYDERQALARDIASRYFDDSYISMLAETLKKSGKALELHCATFSPRESVIKMLVENGAAVSLGSDAHTLSMVGRVEWGMDILTKLGGQSLLYTK